MKPSAARTSAPLRSKTLLTVLALSLTGCASTLPPVTPRLPAAPELTQPPPPEPYSLSAQRDIQTWRKKLTDTSTTQ